MKSEDIKLEAKNIMDNFMSAMKDIEVENDFILERENSFRVEGDGDELDESFKQRFLANAKRTTGDAILANKGEWER